MALQAKGAKTERIEVRASVADRNLIDRAVAASGSDLTSFVMASVTTAAHHVLADRTVFALDTSEREAWEAINTGPAHDVGGLRRLMQRPSPFVDE